MLYFHADPRDAYSANGGDVCNTCCCQPASIRPGERNKFEINYSAWAFGLNARGLTDRSDYSLEKHEQSPDTRLPVNTNYRFDTDFNVALNGTVATNASDPLEGDLTFSVDQLNEPKFGEITMQADGTFVYTPTLGFTGYDTFWFKTSNGAKTRVNQAIVGVSANGAEDPLPAKPFMKDLYIDMKSVNVSKADDLSFTLVASPGAIVGDKYRLTIKQPATDCNCNEYIHISCYDITIGQC